MAPAADYDAPRRHPDDIDQSQQFVTEFTARRGKAAAATNAEDSISTLSAPGFALDPEFGYEQDVRVVPRQADEFTCPQCFLIVHRSRTSLTAAGGAVCRECHSR